MKRDLAYYQALPYSRRVEAIYEGDGRPYWIAWVEELPGCKTDGETHIEAMAHLDAAFDDYIEAMLEFGSEIQDPRNPERGQMAVPVVKVSNQPPEPEKIITKKIPEEMVVEANFATDEQEDMQEGFRFEEPDPLSSRSVAVQVA